MNISEQWLREWVSPDLTTEELAHQITMAGLEVDAIEPVAGLYFRRRTRISGESDFSQVASMDQLPGPFATSMSRPPAMARFFMKRMNCI